MPQLPSISDAEWQVMQVLWDGGQMTSGEVVEALAARTGWHARTIKTLLARLVRKRAVEAQADGKAYRYRARVARAAVVKREARSFVDRVFGGAAAPALVQFIKEARLSPEEIDELKRILDEEARP